MANVYRRFWPQARAKLADGGGVSAFSLAQNTRSSKLAEIREAKLGAGPVSFMLQP